MAHAGASGARLWTALLSTASCSFFLSKIKSGSCLLIRGLVSKWLTRILDSPDQYMFSFFFFNLMYMGVLHMSLQYSWSMYVNAHICAMLMKYRKGYHTP